MAYMCICVSVDMLFAIMFLHWYMTMLGLWFSFYMLFDAGSPIYFSDSMSITGLLFWGYFKWDPGIKLGFSGMSIHSLS